MTDFLLLAGLIGAVLAIALCAICPRRKRPSFWLAWVSASVTGIGVLLFTYGSALFTQSFWFVGKAPGWALVVTVFGLSAIASLAVSFVVVLVYRFSRDGVG
jgi:hypothetical protein